MIPILTDEEVRILGCLIEKEMTTPDYYPLTLNALVAACNQKSNRNPLMEIYDKAMVRALDNLRVSHHLACLYSASGSRTPRYLHTLHEVFSFSDIQKALLCELFIRGPQTPGELRTRCARMCEGITLQDVEENLRQLSSDEEHYVKKLSVQPGKREARWMHLFAGEDIPEEESIAAPQEKVRVVIEQENQRIEALEAEIQQLKEQFTALQAAFAEFKQQFI